MVLFHVYFYDVCFVAVIQCCPTFLTLWATQEINHEAAGRTDKLESNERLKFVEHYS